MSADHESPRLSVELRSEDGPSVRKTYGANQSVTIFIQDGVITISVKGDGEPSAVARAEQPGGVDELSQERSRRALATIGHLFTRPEAAAYTRRSVQMFDRTLRPHLRNAGSPGRPFFLKEDIDQCLRNLPSPGASEGTPAASTTASGSPMRGFVTRSRQAKAILKKLRSVPLDSTRK